VPLSTTFPSSSRPSQAPDTLISTGRSFPPLGPGRSSQVVSLRTTASADILDSSFKRPLKPMVRGRDMFKCRYGTRLELLGSRGSSG